MLDTAPHDLLRLTGAVDSWLPDDAPDWVRAALDLAPWVVVRRAACADGLVAVGVRGQQRHERYAGWIGTSQVADLVSPEDLLACDSAPGRRALPAMKLLTCLRPWFVEQRLAGGPTGSTGFELASERAVVRPASDLDLLLRPAQPFTRTVAQELCNSLHLLSGQAGCRIDVQVEASTGAFALADYALHDRVLLRTWQGAVLTADPWLPA